MKNPKIAAKDLDEFVVRRTFKKNEFENFIEEQEKIFKRDVSSLWNSFIYSISLLYRF